MKMDKDLFGRKILNRKTRLEIYLAKYDRETFPGRLERLQWLQKVFPKGYGMLASPETAYIFDEIKMTFLNGQHISTILLVAAFLEHWLGGILYSKGYKKESSYGLKSIIDCMRKHSLHHDYLLNKADRVREIRNPFVHMKGYEHEARVTRRAIKERRDPFSLLDEDAREAMMLIYQIVTTRTS